MGSASNYHRMRELEERELAADASDETARISHTELANSHAEMARELDERELPVERARA